MPDRSSFPAFQDRERRVWTKTRQPFCPCLLEKYRRLRALGEACGFLVPAVLDADNQQGVLHLERFSSLVSLRSLYLACLERRASAEEVAAYFFEAGRILAAIHALLDRDDFRTWHPGPDFRKHLTPTLVQKLADPIYRRTWAPLHCDYGFGNVFLAPSVKQNVVLVILDAEENTYTTQDPCVIGPRELDMANMVACTLGMISPRLYFRVKDWKPARDCLERFIDGYVCAGKGCVDHSALEAFTFATVHTYARRRFPYAGRFLSKAFTAVRLSWLQAVLARRTHA